jgi:hypothetical protein
MTKKHLTPLGDFIRTHNVECAYRHKHGAPFVTEHLTTLCAFMASTNPRFNRSQWLAYVGAITPDSQKWEKVKS